jgi:predicted ribosome quality control (RQC) complex YloA/Tae2 family protein
MSLGVEKINSGILLAILIMMFSTSVSAYEEPNITELRDSFGDTYEFNEQEIVNTAISERQIRFDQNESIELCVSEVEHEKQAELEFDSLYASDIYPGSMDGRCLTYNLTEKYYEDTVELTIQVRDTYPSRTMRNSAGIEYNNTVDPLASQGGSKTTTDYEYSLIKTEEKNELEKQVTDLNDTVRSQESKIEDLEADIQDKNEEIDSLKEELSNLKSGFSGLIISLF